LGSDVEHSRVGAFELRLKVSNLFRSVEVWWQLTNTKVTPYRAKLAPHWWQKNVWLPCQM